MGAAAVEVTDFVFLELQAVNHPGFLSLGLLFLFSARLLILILVLVLRGFEFLGRGIAENQNEATTVRGPGEVIHVLRSVRQALSLPAEAVQKPDLGFAFVSGGKKGEVLAVGAPAGMGGGNSFGGHGHRFAAANGNPPDALFVLVLLEEGRLDGVGDPLAVRAQLRVADLADLEVVVNRNRPRRGRGRLRVSGGRWDENCAEQDQPSGELHQEDSFMGNRAETNRRVYHKPRRRTARRSNRVWSPVWTRRGRVRQHEGIGARREKNFAWMHFPLACRDEPCILRVRIRFTAAARVAFAQGGRE